MKLETHMHTSQVSGCGKLTGETMAEMYAAAGYGAVIVTDHITRETPKGDFFLSGFQAVRKRAEELSGHGPQSGQKNGETTGLLVLPGAEARLIDRGEEDYLIYGPQTEVDFAVLLRILQEKPSLADFSRQIHENGWLIIQAHPYRDGKTVAQAAACLDGVEAVNGNPRHTPYNEKALAFARANRLMMTGGSDAHRVEDVARSGVYVPLRYNYDKPEKPRISRVFGYQARFFILFQPEKSSREVVIS